jgi:hypothetical protein
VSTLQNYQAPNHEVVHLNAPLNEALQAEQISTAGQLKVEGGKLMLPGATKEALKALPKFEYAK